MPPTLPYPPPELSRPSVVVLSEFTAQIPVDPLLIFSLALIVVALFLLRK